MHKDSLPEDTEAQIKTGCCGRMQPCCASVEDTTEQAEQDQSTDDTQSDEMTTVGLLQKQLQQVQRTADEHKDKYLRILAEMENMRKRTQKEKQDFNRYATESIIIDLLTPFDQFETALQYADKMSDEVKNWAMGFNMILSQLKDVLAAQEVRAFESIGQPFNPHLHEAVEMLESAEHVAGTIVKEYTKGYKMGERIIRPARVQVTKMVEQAEKS